MKRTNSWKNIKRTFASTPIQSVKRAKVKRTNLNNSKSSLDTNQSFQIEDSDEENVPDRIPLKTPTKIQKSKLKTVKSIPLLINTSINANKTTETIAWNSDSDESVDDEIELNTSTRLLKKARSKSLSFLTKDEPNPLNTSNNKRSTLKDITPNKQQQSKSNKCHQLVKNVETNIESDSSDEIKSPTKQNHNCTGFEKLERQYSDDIFFTQSTSNASNLVIESTSSQFSLSLKSQQSLPNKRNKSKKHVKGGLVERLHKILNGIKSDFSFWMNERTSNLTEPGTKFNIEKIERSYGRILLHCTSNHDQKTNANIQDILCIDPSYKKLTMLQVGKTIEVCFDTNGYRNKNGSIFYPNVTKILIIN